MNNYPKTIPEKAAFFAAKKAEMQATPMLMSVEETPASIRKSTVTAKLAELNARNAAKSNPQ
jgi:hypothetical protein